MLSKMENIEWLATTQRKGTVHCTAAVVSVTWRQIYVYEGMYNKKKSDAGYSTVSATKRCKKKYPSELKKNSH